MCTFTPALTGTTTKENGRTGGHTPGDPQTGDTGMNEVVQFLTPWEFSPLVLFACLTAAVVYTRGLRARDRTGPIGWAHPLAFYVGLLAVYLVMQTRIDYFSQHMFWVHRVQHLVLHHVGPFLIMLALPHEIMPAGVPMWLRRHVLRPWWHSRPTQWIYRSLQHPLIAALLFVGLIAFWLTPSVHFAAMLSESRYRTMNLSMLIDGLLFWWLILDPRPPAQHHTLGFGTRILLLWAVMIPQLLIGAIITFSHHILYDVYNVCGRAWSISPMVDQELGGLNTWIPAAMMSVIGGLVVLRLWMRSQSSHASATDTESAQNNTGLDQRPHTAEASPVLP